MYIDKKKIYDNLFFSHLNVKFNMFNNNNLCTWKINYQDNLFFYKLNYNFGNFFLYFI